MVKIIPPIFVREASEIIADTNKGISGSQIVQICSAFAIEFNVEIPYDSIKKLQEESPNKRNALYENLMKFSTSQQLKIIKNLCEHTKIKDLEAVKNLKIRLISRYGDIQNILEEDLHQTIIETHHWLEDFPESLRNYNEAMLKNKNRLFERNLLDDLRLSFELLLKKILNNQKSLENQNQDLGKFIKIKEVVQK